MAEVAPGKDLKAKATKLTEGHKYIFRVVAENSIGTSDPCETEQITAKLPFGDYLIQLPVNFPQISNKNV